MLFKYSTWRRPPWKSADNHWLHNRLWSSVKPVGITQLLQVGYILLFIMASRWWASSLFHFLIFLCLINFWIYGKEKIHSKNMIKWITFSGFFPQFKNVLKKWKYRHLSQPHLTPKLTNFLTLKITQIIFSINRFNF